MSKPTLATLKSFIRKNRDALLVNVESSFDGMTDCVENTRDSTFRPAEAAGFEINTLGVRGVWIVRGGRDYVAPLKVPGYTGFYVSNCCGSFSVAIRTGTTPAPAEPDAAELVRAARTDWSHLSTGWEGSLCERQAA